MLAVADEVKWMILEIFYIIMIMFGAAADQMWKIHHASAPGPSALGSMCSSDEANQGLFFAFEAEGYLGNKRLLKHLLFVLPPVAFLNGSVFFVNKRKSGKPGGEIIDQLRY